MMTPARTRAPGQPGAPPDTTPKPIGSAGLSARTPRSRSGIVGALSGRARIGSLPYGICAARDLVGDGTVQTERLGLPRTAVGASREVLLQPPLGDAWRQILLVEPGGERGAGTGAEHAFILPDPHRRWSGEPHDG